MSQERTQKMPPKRKNASSQNNESNRKVKKVEMTKACFYLGEVPASNENNLAIKKAASTLGFQEKHLKTRKKEYEYAIEVTTNNLNSFDQRMNELKKEWTSELRKEWQNDMDKLKNDFKNDFKKFKKEIQYLPLRQLVEAARRKLWKENKSLYNGPYKTNKDEPSSWNTFYKQVQSKLSDSATETQFLVTQIQTKWEPLSNQVHNSLDKALTANFIELLEHEQEDYEKIFQYVFGKSVSESADRNRFT